MAVFLSIKFSPYYAPPPFSASSSASTTPKNLQHHQFETPVALQPRHHRFRLPLTSKPHSLAFNLSNSSPFANNKYRRSFRSSIRAQDSTSQKLIDFERSYKVLESWRSRRFKKTSDDKGQLHDTKISEKEADPGRPFNLKTLINVYKEAILDGDGKTISEVESMVCILENEKNEMAHKLSAVSAEIKSGKEKYIRLQADFDNFRKRSEKERLTIRSDAQGEVIESLLPMVDSFEKAKQQIKPETEKERKIDTSYQGIYKQFVEIMRNLRVAPVPTVGRPFDPSVHEAIAREESQDFKAGMVIQELRRGFLLGDRLVRPAMVTVSTGPGKNKPTTVTEKSTGQSIAAAGLDER